MLPTWYDHTIQLQPQQPLEDTLKQLPGRWCVYLMCDAAGQPVQMLAVKNLRASVQRRLSENPDDTLTKRVDYRAVVREIRYKRVDGALESDLAYLDSAKAVFPDSYRQLLSQRQTWFIHVDPDADFPRWTRVDDPSSTRGIVFGPIQEKNQAQKLIETIEDAFDLCRYHHILTQSPGGVPCAYKDMHRCPAPCDGSVSMQQYKALIRWSIDTLCDPSNEIDQQTARMAAAAGDLKFEVAGKIRQFIAQIESFRKTEWRYVRPMEDFRFLSLQPGPRKGHAKLFAITPNGIECVMGLRSEPDESLLQCDPIRHLMQPAPPSAAIASSSHESSREQISLAVKHLFSPKSTGVFIHADDLNPRSLVSAYKQISKRQPEAEQPESANDDEGVIAEMKHDAFSPA